MAHRDIPDTTFTKNHIPYLAVFHFNMAMKSKRVKYANIGKTPYLRGIRFWDKRELGYEFL